MVKLLAKQSNIDVNTFFMGEEKDSVVHTFVYNSRKVELTSRCLASYQLKNPSPPRTLT